MTEIDKGFREKLKNLLDVKLKEQLSNIPEKAKVYDRYPELNKHDIESFLRKKLLEYSKETKADTLQFFNFVRSSNYIQKQRVDISTALLNYLKVIEFLMEIAVIENFFEENNICDFLFSLSQGRGIGKNLIVVQSRYFLLGRRDC